MYTNANANLASAVARNLQWLDATKSGDPMAWAGVMNDPNFRQVMQDVWYSNGGTGTFDEGWAKQQIATVHDPRLNTDVGAIIHNVDQLVANGYMDADTAEAWKWLAQNNMGIDMRKYVKRNADGSVEIDGDGLLEAVGGEEGESEGEEADADKKTPSTPSRPTSRVITTEPPPRRSSRGI
jgi:hypothetical protein